MKKSLALANTLLAFCFVGFKAHSQEKFAGYEHLFTTPKNYIIQHTTAAPKIDGDLNDAAWLDASWTDHFIDIEGEKKAKPLYSTRVKMLWSDSCLFIAAELEEPHVWAKLKQHDAIIYYDNDFEVFIDPTNDTHQYFEIEVNAFNTILDLFMPKPYRNGGSAMLSYNIAGLQSALQVKGTLNNSSDKDKSWTVEMAIPFRAIYIGNHWRPPQEGALWRINFSRVQWETELVNGAYVKKKDKAGKPLPEYNWVWSPQGVINMHFPERWGYLVFSKTKENKTFVLPSLEKRRQYLWWLYYKQKAFFSRHKKYAGTLQDLDIKENNIAVEGIMNRLQLEATSRQFSVYITDPETTLSINEEGLVQTIKNRL
ncbi:carbohydrate-binding family 9-like protein [Flavisolibacter sp. BT320]|nr:carbohydrate-binding family 9-like protein [Flavisolibacter longurius]